MGIETIEIMILKAADRGTTHLIPKVGVRNSERSAAVAALI